MTRGRPRTAPEHGSWASYQRHLRASEKPCEECRTAARAYRRENSLAQARTAAHRFAIATEMTTAAEITANQATAAARRTRAWAAHATGDLVLGNGGRVKAT